MGAKDHSLVTRSDDLQQLTDTDGFEHIIMPLLVHLGWHQDYRGAYLLVREIDRLLSNAHKYDIDFAFAPIPGTTDLAVVADAFSRAASRLGNLTAPSTKQRVEGYEVAVYLSSKPLNTKPILGRGMKLYFLKSCWATLNLDQSVITSFANELRLLDSPVSKTNQRPNYLEDLRLSRAVDFEVKFINHTSDFLNGVGASKLPGDFAKSLLFLLGNQPPRKVRRKSPAVPRSREPAANEPAPRSRETLRLGKYGFPLPEVETLPEGVSTKTLDLQGMDALVVGEAPDKAQVVVIDPREMSDEAFVAEYGHARRWLQSAQNVTKVSSSVLSRIEKRLLLKAFEELHSNSTLDRCRFEATLLLALSYSIGQDINRILEVSCWKRGVFDESGKYNFSIIQPDRSYSPRAHIERFRPLLDNVSLTLPELIREPVAFHTGSRSPRPLAECLQSAPEALADSVSGILSDLQGDGTFNITAHTVMNGLKNQVLIQTESPLLAYHLCHKEGDAMPAMGWYQSVNAQTLIQVYDDCADYIFSQSH